MQCDQKLGIRRTSGLALVSDTEAYAGHMGNARELAKRALDSAIRADRKESGAIWQSVAAQWWKSPGLNLVVELFY